MADESIRSAATSQGPSPNGEGWSLRGALAGAVQRLRGTPRRWLIIGAGGAACGFGLVLVFVAVQRQGAAEVEASMALALSQLENGQFEQARATATDLRLAGARVPGEEGTEAYVLGVAMAHDAELERALPERRALYLLAARYLEEARAAGFPPGRGGHGDYLLGSCLFEAGRYAACLPALKRALETFPGNRSEIHARLAEAYLRDVPPQLEEAHDQNRLYLASAALTGPQRQNAILTQAEIEFRLGQLGASRASLELIPGDSQVAPQAALLRGRLALHAGDRALAGGAAGDAAQRAADSYREARDTFAAVADDSAVASDVRRRAQYLVALSRRKLGHDAQAEELFSQIRHSYYQTPEGLAAGLHLAELQRAQGRHEEAISSFLRVLRQAADMPVYSNLWLTFDELRERAEDAYRAYYEAGEFGHAVRMAESLAPLLSAEQAVQLRADALQAQAEAMASTDVPTPARLTEARATWRRAAALYEELARLRFATRLYPEAVRRSAEAYLRGQDYRRAERLLELYLRNELRRRHPPALVALGEARLALDEPAEAILALNECIESFPRDPHIYRARLIAARAHLENGDDDAAKRLLTDNLEHESLTPRSPEWRESLYLLGEIHHHLGLKEETQSRLQGIDSLDPETRREAMKSLERATESFQQAITLLTEAVQRDALSGRDPYLSETTDAMYLIADASRQLAKLPLHRLDAATIETTRNRLNAQIQRSLAAAEVAYRRLQQRLSAKQESQPLSDRERQILRNCYFARADVLYDLDNLEEAIQAYATATNRYQHEPEALEAYVQIANCHRRLDRPAEARGTLEQAKVVLQRIREDADFVRTTRYGRAEWQVLLDWLTTL